MPTPIDKLNLTTRAKNCLAAENICTVEELTERGAGFLLSVPNLGITTLYEIASALAELGLSIDGFSPDKAGMVTPTKRSAMIQIAYWTCLFKEHGHESHREAEDCIARLLKITRRREQ